MPFWRVIEAGFPERLESDWIVAYRAREGCIIAMGMVSCAAAARRRVRVLVREILCFWSGTRLFGVGIVVIHCGL